MPSFEILHDYTEGTIAIRCLDCGHTSYNPHDVTHRYCGHCHRFLLDPPGKYLDPPSEGC
jgi:hypothetical protein